MAENEQKRSYAHRGGGWYDVAGICRSAYRLNDSPGLCFGYLGFRIARRYQFYRSVRGGSYLIVYNTDFAPSACRNWGFPDQPHTRCGFRVGKRK